MLKQKVEKKEREVKRINDQRLLESSEVVAVFMLLFKSLVIYITILSSRSKLKSPSTIGISLKLNNAFISVCWPRISFN